MPVRYAVATGNWSNTAIWDNGALPTSSDTVYPNGFTVTIDQDITIQSLNNNISAVRLPDMSIPAMTGNTQPSGLASASVNLATAWQAFDQNSGTSWSTGANTIGNISYQFTSGKIIKRYYWQSDSINRIPSAWTFQASNDGTTWTTIETVTGHTLIDYTSGATVAANTTSYTYYRINITTNAVPTNGTLFIRFEMTESTSTSYGVTTGGTFTVPASLSGSRNIVQSGAGIISNNTNTVLTTAHTSGNTVNMNISGGGYIFNPNNQTSFGAFYVCQITGTGTTNFNGDIWGTQTSSQYNTLGLIGITNSAIVNVFGNCYGAKINNLSYPVFNLNTGSNSAILNITGNLIGSDTTSGFLSYIVFNQTLATVNITGNLTSNLGYCYYSTTNGTLNIPSGTITVTNTNSVPAILMTGTTSLLTLNSPIINKVNVNAVLAVKIRFYSTATPYWVFQNNLSQDITLAYGSATGAYPAEADVRFGVTYAASPTRTGTCRVPLPQYVSQGVLVDATVGTAYLSATDVWNVLTSTITTSGSIGERLKNASTVQTTGDQLASYQV